MQNTVRVYSTDGTVSDFDCESTEGCVEAARMIAEHGSKVLVAVAIIGRNNVRGRFVEVAGAVIVKGDNKGVFSLAISGHNFIVLGTTAQTAHVWAVYSFARNCPPIVRI